MLCFGFDLAAESEIQALSVKKTEADSEVAILRAESGISADGGYLLCA